MSNKILWPDLFDVNDLHIEPKEIALKVHETQESLDKVRKRLFAKIAELSADIMLLQSRLLALETQGLSQ